MQSLNFLGWLTANKPYVVLLGCVRQHLHTLACTVGYVVLLPRLEVYCLRVCWEMHMSIRRVETLLHIYRYLDHLVERQSTAYWKDDEVRLRVSSVVTTSGPGNHLFGMLQVLVFIWPNMTQLDEG